MLSFELQLGPRVVHSARSIGCVWRLDHSHRTIPSHAINFCSLCRLFGYPRPCPCDCGPLLSRSPVMSCVTHVTWYVTVHGVVGQTAGGVLLGSKRGTSGRGKQVLTKRAARCVMRRNTLELSLSSSRSPPSRIHPLIFVPSGKSRNQPTQPLASWWHTRAGVFHPPPSGIDPCGGRNIHSQLRISDRGECSIQCAPSVLSIQKPRDGHFARPLCEVRSSRRPPASTRHPKVKEVVAQLSFTVNNDEIVYADLSLVALLNGYRSRTRIVGGEFHFGTLKRPRMLRIRRSSALCSESSGLCASIIASSGSWPRCSS
ncbi:hypothetical protein BC835DRAFT_571232 [Cytidiella melzeri]|nr:hypothetical protein BC835DRAFT_571232 [Cytidiella melzeri]